MKVLLFFIPLFFITSNLQSQICKTINNTAGSFSSPFTWEETSNKKAKKLIVTGTIDARDFKVIRDELTATIIDLSNTQIVAYDGKKGTSSYFAPTGYIIDVSNSSTP